MYSIQRVNNPIKGALILVPTKFTHFVFRFEIAYSGFMEGYRDAGEMYMSFRKNNKILNRIFIGEWHKQLKDVIIDR